MKTKVSLVALATALSIGSAFAADLPSIKAPPYIPPPPVLWTGFYAGLNAGYGWGTSSDAYTLGSPVYDTFNTYAGYGAFGSTALANTAVAQVNQSGFIGGGQIGYNYQYGSSIVFGLEVDIQGAGIRGSGSSYGASVDSDPLYNPDRIAIGGNSVNAHLDWLGTVAGRVGYLVTPATLLYVRGGLAYGGASASTTSSVQGYEFNSDYGFMGAGTGQTSSTLVGWHIGGGAEWLFAPNWSVKLEAFYYDLGSLNVSTAPFAVAAYAPEDYGFANATQTRVKFDGVVARVGVNYHFNSFAPAPVLAKY